MSSPEMERFEVLEEDLENEFNPNRPQYRQTKHQAIYGIWADKDSDDEISFSGARKKKDFTAPIGFVSGGIKVGDKITSNKKEKENDEEYESGDEPKKSTMSLMKKRAKKMSGYDTTAHKDQAIGSWERHTRGIGMKLLEKMGHVPGKGLGKDLQGISAPVEANKRRGKAAIGFYGTERTKQSLIDFPREDESEETESKGSRKLHQWKKGDNDKKKKPKYIYKTADEIINSGDQKKMPIVQSELSKVKVIDMTGREQRVLSGYHAIAHKHDMPDEAEDVTYAQTEKRAFDLPELIHNLDLLVDMAESEIVQNNKQLKHEQDMAVNLRHEKEKLDGVVEQEKKQLARLHKIMSLIDSLESRKSEITLEECANLLKMLREDYAEEYHQFDLSTVATSIVLPIFKREFQGWDPLERPRLNIALVREWRQLLDEPEKQVTSTSFAMNAYDRLIWDVWTPHIRTTIINNWEVRQPDALVEVLEAWKPLLPPWVLTNVLEQLVFTRLQPSVEHWSPTSDTVPIHSWLHPWLPLMGDSLEPLYAPIRHKLANALTGWHPSDPSAKIILQPWTTVFQPGHMEAFLVKNICPKLSVCLDEFVINPHQQHLDRWNWVMSWLGVIPHNAMVTILDKHFFPKWLQVLCAWLSNQPNYDEVTKWYLGWKSMFDEKIISDMVIKARFNKALEIMNRAVSGTLQPGSQASLQPGARENVAYLTTNERRQDIDTEYSRNYSDNSASSTPPALDVTMRRDAPSSFRELVERKAAENNVVFMPVLNRTYEAKQVYKFGNVLVYIDRNVLFALDNQNWSPIGLNQLILMNR